MSPREQDASASVPSARPPMGWNDAFRFGKYKGLLVSEVASFNPEYLAWACANLSGFDLDPEARKLGQRDLNRHREQSMQRQNGWAWGFGASAKQAASAWSSKMVRLEMDARRAAEKRAPAQNQRRVK